MSDMTCCTVIYFQSLTKEDLEALLLPLSQVKARPGELEEKTLQRSKKRARYRAKQIFHWVYQRFVTEWDEMTDLSKDLRSWLKENVEIFRLSQKTAQQSLDGTMKFLWNLDDRKTIESVIIPAALKEKDRVPGENDEVDGQRFAGDHLNEEEDLESFQRLTACISSQVGCAMGCKFCLTGIQGLDRSLETHEIVTQVFELRRLARITNIVFMGMGEPLHNLENVIKACKILIDDDGFNLSKRKVTVSTSGLVPAIDRLGQSVDVSLAISLNGSTDDQRSQIMPVNKRWNIDELIAACRRYPLGAHRRITFEYVMISGLNDSLEDAKRLVGLVGDIRSIVNLIPFNEHPGVDYKRPSDERVREFQNYLLNRGVTATVRISKGRDILAACGQLRSLFGTARGTDRHRDFRESVS